MLDFSIYSDQERCKAVTSELGSIVHPTNAQLEMMANYILYGKDQNDQNAVDRKEVYIPTKYNSYKKRRVDSLDELKELPTFNEADLQPIHRSIYKNPKPELDLSAPEMEPILYTIAQYESQIEDLKNLPETQEIRTKIYNLNHMLIELRREQYAFQDILKQPIKLISYNQPYKDPISDTLCENIGPMGLKIGELTRFVNPKEDKSYAIVEDFFDSAREGLNLENPTHIYLILQSYETLYEKSIDNPFINAKYLVETIDWYISQVPFDQSRLDIIYFKKHHYPNSYIRQYLKEHYGKNYSENYISTIYTKEICKKIAAAVTLVKDRWESRFKPNNWKVCSCCGQWRLKDPREFIRKRNSDDGYAARCKVCDRKKKNERLKRKEEERKRLEMERQAQELGYAEGTKQNQD